MSAPCTRLPAYLDGRLTPDDEAAFERHLADCATCDAALGAALDDPLDADLTALADVTCPPGVVEAALAAVRQPAPPSRRPARPLAADRAARRGRPVRSWAVAAAVVLAALVVALLWRPSGTAVSPAPAVAERGGAETATPRSDAPVPDIARAAPPRPDADVEADATPADAPVSAPETPVTETAPAETAPPDDLAATRNAPSGPDDAAPTEAEIDAASRDLQLAFSLVAGVQRQADRALRHETGALDALDTALPHLAP